MLWRGSGEVTAALMSTQVAFRGQGRGIIDYVLVLHCVKVFYFSIACSSGFNFHILSFTSFTSASGATIL